MAKLYLLLSLFFCHLTAHCQYYGYEDWSYSANIPNKPEFNISNNTIKSFNDSVLVLKTTSIYKKNDLYNFKDLSNKKFSYLIKENLMTADNRTQSLFVRDNKTHAYYSLGIGQYLYAYDLENCLIQFFIQANGKKKIAVFNYLNPSVLFYDLSINEIIGRNDTCIYFAPSAFVQNRTNYYKGTIVALNENGFNFVASVIQKNQANNIDYIFFSGSFNVTQNSDNWVYINYNNVRIDSFEETRIRSFRKPQIYTHGDTLIYVSLDDCFRKYVSNITSIVWEYNLRKNKNIFPVPNYISYSNWGDLVFLKLTFSISYTRGMQLKENGLFTLNGLLINPECNKYDLVLVYDLKKNIFLGYPKIEFAD